MSERWLRSDGTPVPIHTHPVTGTGWCRLRDEGDYVRLILASGSPGMCVVPRSEWESWLRFGSWAAVRRHGLVRTVARVLADGGPIDDEMDAAEQVVEAIVTYLLDPEDGDR